jgi:hypothetical protein
MSELQSSKKEKDGADRNTTMKRLAGRARAGRGVRDRCRRQQEVERSRQCYAHFFKPSGEGRPSCFRNAEACAA